MLPWGSEVFAEGFRDGHVTCKVGDLVLAASLSEQLTFGLQFCADVGGGALLDSGEAFGP